MPFQLNDMSRNVLSLSLIYKLYTFFSPSLFLSGSLIILINGFFHCFPHDMELRANCFVLNISRFSYNGQEEIISERLYILQS